MLGAETVICLSRLFSPKPLEGTLCYTKNKNRKEAGQGLGLPSDLLVPTSDSSGFRGSLILGVITLNLWHEALSVLYFAGVFRHGGRENKMALAFQSILPKAAR